MLGIIFFLFGIFFVVFFGEKMILYLENFNKFFREFKKECERFEKDASIPWYIYNTYQEVMCHQEDYLDCMRTNIRRIAEKLEVQTRLMPQNRVILDLDVDDIGLPDAISEALFAVNVKNTKQLLEMSENQVLEIKGIDKEKLSFIKDLLAEYGYRLASQNHSNIPVDLLNLSVRTTNILKNENIRTVGDLLNLTKNGIKKIRNIGTDRVKEIEIRLQQKGFLPLI